MPWRGVIGTLGPRGTGEGTGEVDDYYLVRIQRGVDYIESRLDEPLSLGSVAREAGVSQWHFQRMFKALTGDTLKGYIRSRRLARSLERLLTTDMRVLDVALLAGFDSQEAFSRAFRKAFDLSPLEYRRVGRRHRFLKKVQIDQAYLTHVRTQVSLEPELVDMSRLQLVGMHTRFFGTASEKNNVAERLPPLWDHFIQCWDQVQDRVQGTGYGVIGTAPDDGELLEYYAACAVTAPARPPRGMVSLSLPAARYALFKHVGRAQNLDHTVSYAYSTWLMRSGHRHSYGYDLEIYGPKYHPTRADAEILYGIPIAT